MKLLNVVNLININTCIFWCKISGLFIHWYMSCDYMTFVIRPYDKCRINAWHMSRNRKKGFLASYKLRHCYHPSHPCQFARRGMWWGRGYLLHLRTWEGAESYRCHQEKKVLRHHKKMLHYQNKRLQKCVSQILFVLLPCHSELCFIFAAR